MFVLGIKGGAMEKVHVVQWNDIQFGEPGSDPNDHFFRYRVLAEGDSWFSLRGIPSSNLLFQMKLPRTTIVVNMGSPGATISKMAEIAADSELGKAMSSLHGYKWHAILLSGGGNDLIDDADLIIRKPSRYTDPADCCDENELMKTLDRVEAGYRTIVELRDQAGSSCKGKPILTHTYDYVTPRNSPSRFLFMPLKGPWLYTALKNAGIQTRYWNDVSDYLLFSLAERIESLATGPDKLPAFHVVNTINTLVPAELGATHDSNDWIDEIHPNSDGYKKIASKLAKKLAKVLP